MTIDDWLKNGEMARVQKKAHVWRIDD